MNKKYKLLSWAGILVALAVFVLVNVFMSVLTRRVPVKIDLTSNKRYELTEESYAYLKEYTADTTIYILASQTEQDTNARAILDHYEAANSHIKIKNVDISRDPGFGREYVSDGETLEENSVIVASGGKSRVISGAEFYAIEDGTIAGLDVESKITSALKYVSSETALKACFTTGHGEADFRGAKEALEAENYTVSEINTLTADIPADTSLLILPRPVQDFSTAEIAKLDAYAHGGGNIQVYVSGECPELPNLNGYLAGNGISINQSVIAESQESTIASQGSYMFLMNYVKNDVTDSVISKKKVSGYLPFAKSLKKTATSGAITVSSYLTSTDSSYTSSNLDRPTRDTADSEGAADIALMSENSETGGKIYVCGTAMLLTYPTADINNTGLANIEYFTAAANYMTDAGSAFVVPVKAVGAERIVMNSIVKSVLFVIVVILVPCLLLAAGTAVFFRRRNL